MLQIKQGSVVLAALAALALAGCGSSSSSSSSSPSSSSAGSTGGSSSTSAAALAADAHSAATGDIPDNQVFLTFTDQPAGWSMKYPEGWTQSGSGRDVTFRDKNNVVHVTISSGAAPSVASVTAQLQALKRSTPTLSFEPPHPISLTGGPAIAAKYTTESAADPVTGRKVKLLVDRYEFAKAGRAAIADLGTPTGVDNVDAYKMMIDSFRWR
jgi:hypothetical protein